MVPQSTPKLPDLIINFLRGTLPLAFLFLLIEFFDELNYGIGNAALPAIRSGLGLSYVQVGILLGAPGVINTFIEPLLMLLGDTRFRKRIILAGGAACILSLGLIASAHSFPLLLLGMVIGFPASGAFVSLSQATLMDLNPGREPQMMARWTAAGSVANLVGPLLLAAGFALGFGWRWAFWGLAGLCTVLLVMTWRIGIPFQQKLEQVGSTERHLCDVLPGIGKAIRRPHLLRWMILLQFSDLLLDVLTGYLPLYFTDVTGMKVTQSSLMMSFIMLAGLVSNLVLIPVLDKFPGRRLVRLSAGVTGVLYAAWLLAPWLWVKIGLIILIRLVTLGWYEVLLGEAFAAAPDRSGTVMALSSIFGVLGSGMAFVIGWVASHAGLPAAMWILLLGPLSLVLFIPRSKLSPAAEAAR